MGFLDDLKKKSADVEAQEKALAAHQAELEQKYRQQILPRLEYVYTYMSEMCKHLNYIKTDRTVDYEIKGHGVIKGLVQQGYTLNADSRDNMQEVILFFECAKPGEIEVHTDSKKNFDQLNDYYSVNKLKYRFKLFKDEYQEQIGGNFYIENKIPIVFLFKADIENSVIQLFIRNFNELGLRKFTLTPDKISEDFMDTMAKYIVHETPDFMRLDVSEDVRQQLQQKIREEQAARQREMEEAEKLAQQEAEREKQQAGLFDKIKKGFQDIQKK